MSTWDPGSELSRFNASASTGWFAVSADTLAVVEEGLRVARVTGGAFDVTVGPLVELWGFGPDGVRARPSDEALAAARVAVGSAGIEARTDPPAIRKRDPRARLDVSAIAKGFAVDAIAVLLAEEGARGFLVEVGGEVRAAGRKAEGEPWRVAVERPPPVAGAPPRVLELVDRAVATSGDYRAVFEEDGTRYPHVIDPRTGLPVTTGVASATVLAATAMEADAFATALMVLPPADGLRLAEREGLAARLLVRAGGGFVERTTADFPSAGGAP